MTGLADLTVEEIRDREQRFDRMGRFMFAQRDRCRAELASRLDKPLEDLFPRPARRSDRQRVWTDADRARLVAERQRDGLAVFVQRVAELPDEPSVTDLAELVVDARALSVAVAA